MRSAAGLDVVLTQEGARRLEEFEAMLGDRAIPLGLVSRSDASRIRERHVLDCLRAVAALGDSDATAYDIGTGAGLPGVVVAAARPGLVVRLVEPRRTRVAFLEWVVDALSLTNATVVPGRIQDQREEADICFARAFAPLPESWEAARPLLRRGGRLVYFGEASEAVASLEGATRVEIRRSPLLACSGPLTIMTR